MRIGFYSDTKWALGSIHSELCARLTDFGIDAKILDWSVGHIISNFHAEIMALDCVVTLPGGGSIALTTSYGIPKEKIVLIAHGEPDILTLFTKYGRSAFDGFRDFAVVSESIYSSALTLGIRPPSAILPMGVNCEKYFADVSSELKVVGYGTIQSRKNEFGVEIKRGELARKCALAAGLQFSPAEGIRYQDMPAYYRTVDAVIMPSLQEGAPLPPLEAAAAGRLVIGSPAGHFPRLAYQGAGILAPLDEDRFIDFVVEALKFFKEHPEAYREKCREIQVASQSFDWSKVIEGWASFLWKQQSVPG